MKSLIKWLYSQYITLAFVYINDTANTDLRFSLKSDYLCYITFKKYYNIIAKYDKYDYILRL